MAQRGTSEKMAIPQELKIQNSKLKKAWKNNGEGDFWGCCAAPEPVVESIPEPAAAKPVVVEVVEVAPVGEVKSEWVKKEWNLT